ncbi:formimidoylglutamate deiminase [Roseiarcus fermentans]|uniref:Formimidoylglutamate deiminase n=1 Tax=Roseiarcus fermentans TaxID=1473586 RepID=A0A366FB31_9HYPH|nr:formimidoylglutamate deiminase [Roseiarcus fermentans]RBP11170.1 formimidoylglutamate deiminase [Roseiarcus fermentans]
MTALHFERALTPEGWASNVRISIDGGSIVSVERGAARAPGDERCGIGVPAIGNLHSHAFQRAMAGLAEQRGDTDDSFWTWREAMYRLALAVTPDDVEAIAAQAYVEMLEAGFGAVAEFHYLHHDVSGGAYANRAEMAERIAAAAAGTGVGLTLLPVFYAHAGFGGAPARPEQRRFVNDLDSYAALVADCRRALGAAAVVGVAPHSLRAATPEELAAVTGLAGDAPIHIHVAEQTAEVEACLAWSGARPVRWLLDHVGVDQRWCLVHATHLDAGEAAALARSRAVVGLCPITEANLGDGVFPARAFLDAGGRFGVGSDSNVEITVAGELRLLEYAQRLVSRARNVCARRGGSTGRALVDGAAAGAAQALGRPGGALAPGAAADIVSLNAGSPLIAGRADDAVLDTWIFGAGRDLVDRVWSGGREVVVEGRHVRREAIAARFGDTLRRLAASAL